VLSEKSAAGLNLFSMPQQQTVSGQASMNFTTE